MITFLDAFIGVSGKVHDAHVTFLPKLVKFNGGLLFTYFSREFYYTIPPSRNVGNFTREEERRNTKISRGRVIIENYFGSLKCKFRRLRDIQNSRFDIVVKIALAACTLHICLDTEYVCEDQPP